MAESLLTLAEVKLRTGLGKTSIYQRIAKGTFPAPRKEEGCASVRWISTEIDAWVADWIDKSVVAGTVVGSKAQTKKKPLKSAA